jgi:hypothetical protein
MILFHGSTLAVKKPEIIRSEHGRDFGFGFYTTDIYDQAKRWALRKARIVNKGVAVSSENDVASAIISTYDFDERHFKNLAVKHFPEPDMEWLEFVCNCRNNPKYSHGFDVVIGKIANDNVGETVSYVAAGVMRKEDAIERLKFERINNQTCFCSEKSLPFLRYTGHEEVAHES